MVDTWNWNGGRAKKSKKEPFKQDSGKTNKEYFQENWVIVIQRACMYIDDDVKFEQSSKHFEWAPSMNNRLEARWATQIRGTNIYEDETIPVL